MIEVNPSHSCRADRFGNKHCWIAAPLNDIDFFAMQFVDNCLNAYAALTYTCPHRIDARLRSRDCYLSTLTRFTGNRANFNDAVINFGHFVFEQPPQKVAVRMRKLNLQTLRGVGNLIKVGTNALVNAEALPRDHVLAFHDAFRFEVQPYRCLPRIYCLYHAADNLTNLFAEVFKLLISFSIVDLLLDGLAGSLRSDAPKICRGRLDHHQIPNLGFWIVLPCFF